MKPVHHLAVAGTVDQISYTACGMPFHDVPSEGVTASFELVTCEACQKRGPRKAPTCAEMEGR